ncbi:MAG TPA: hypothetical protein VLV17_00185 [Anaeromyxobacteraceae bacterium]|nr:hypothetical protein [Anaeromyxobacteraceae bacterium]
MYKALAVLRTVFLVFIIGYTFWAMPVFMKMPNTFDELYSRCSVSTSRIEGAAWIAVAWIAFETLVGWLLVRGKRTRPTGEPSPADPAQKVAPPSPHT